MSEIITGWRVTSPKYAATPEEVLSGEGARLYGGRWNSKGTAVVYLGNSLAQASMEQLVHLGRADVMRSYVKMSVSFDEKLMTHIDLDDLPDDWADETMASSVQAVGDAWVKNEDSVILQVPSAAVRGEYNYLYNPSHPDAGKVTPGDITPFTFDPRLGKA